MSLSAEQLQGANSALEDLESKRVGGDYQALSTFSLDDSAKAASVNFWEVTVVNSIASLRRELDRVNSGEISWERWVGDAQGLYKNMADVAGYTSDWSLSGALLNTAASTAADLRQGAKDIATAAKSGTTWGIGAFVLLGAVYLWWKA